MNLTKEQRQVLVNWVERNFIPIKGVNRKISAYTIHGIFERLYDKGFYITEYDMIDALRQCGYRSEYIDEQYYFNVAEKSRAIQIYRLSCAGSSNSRTLEWL